MTKIAQPSLRPALLRSVSLSALLLASPARAGGGNFRNLSQALAARPSASVAAAATAGGAVAARQAGLGAQNFNRAASQFRTLSQALAAQRYQGLPVPDGVQPGGLQQADGVAGSNNSTLWSGASTTLTQAVAGGTTSVTVDQTSPVAALTWKSFNIGAHTKLVFDQSAGGSRATSWVAINSVQDPTANPTTILGQISAPGKVYILNPNGILFGAGSQVNVGGLVATTANIAQAQFTFDTNGLVKTFSLYGSATGTTNADSFTPTFEAAPEGASVVVQPGAVIATPVPSGTNGGGYVMLLGATVENQGAISTPQGQTVLAAGTDFILQPGYSTSNPTATVIGSEVAVSNQGSITGTGTAALGSATNTGLIIADQGDITMVGHLVTQAGVLLATTTVNQRGTVHLLTDSNDTTASVVLAPGSVSEILPEEIYSYQGSLVTALENPDAAKGTLQTALDAQRAANLASSATDNQLRNSLIGPRLNDFNNLTDTLGESRIEISTGGTLDMQGGALALAQGGQVSVNAAQQILLEPGATIDVSGTNAELPASANSLFVQGIVPYYLRDSAANRTGGLEFANVYIDERTLVQISGGAYAGNIYTQGGLLEVSGNLGLVGHGINEWSSLGGQVNLQSVTTNAGVSTGGTVLLSAGATLNLTGGTVTYDAGMVKQSYVQAADGRVFNINDAPGNLVYTGVYNGQVETHPRWHITQTFLNPLLTPPEIYEPSYVIGRDAGNLTVSAGTAEITGTIQAGVTVGQNQTGARPGSVTDPFILAQSVVPLAGSLAVGAYSGGVLLPQQYGSVVVLGQTGDGMPPPPPPPAPPEVASGTIAIDTGALNNAGFANVSILTAGSLSLADTLTLADGSTLTLGGGTLAIAAGITVHAGTVNLTNLQSSVQALSNAGGITVSSGVVIDTSGEWTNLSVDPDNHTLAGFANGGNVAIISTGGVDLQSGSRIDVSSGGLLSGAGKLTAAAGGNVTVSADILPGTATTYNPSGNVTLAGAFAGFASGAAGTLSIAVPDIVLGTLVGGVPAQLFVLNPNAVLVLPDNSLFASGFSNYVLNGYFGVEVDAGRQIMVTRPSYFLNDTTLPTGSPAAAAYDVLLAPLYTGNPAKDTITQRAGASIALESSVQPALYNGLGGPVFIDPGASITVDPRQSITVFGYDQVTDEGTLVAHGGTITLANTHYDLAVSSDAHTLSNYVPGLSVWIGDTAVIDASGKAALFTDAAGQLYGQAQNGGRIVLGGLGGSSTTSTLSTYAQVIERPGAVIDASGASATVNVVPSVNDGGSPLPVAQAVTLAGNGGTIVARSYDGIAFDGTLLAAGQGPGAAGGALVMRLDLQTWNGYTNLPSSYVAASRILISQDEVPVQATEGLAPGQATDPATSMLGRISQAQLGAGGFDQIDLFAQDYIAFDGAVSLQLGRSVTLQTALLGQTQPDASVSIAAPYVDLVGFNPNANSVFGSLNYGPSGNVVLSPPQSATGTLNIEADMIDLSGAVSLGGAKAVIYNSGSSTLTATAFGFASADLLSTGDLRFDASTSLAEAASKAQLASSANITLQAAQLYPASGANAAVYAGANAYLSNTDTTTNIFAGGTLSVLGTGGAAPGAPYSIDGTLALVSETVLQDGVVRAPEGLLLIGASQAADANDGFNFGQQVTNSVILGPESITSVSLYGQIVPYGGTVDGVNYTYAGAAALTFQPTLAIGTAQLVAQPGSQIDLRGGGTLAGAGFIPGRGGTADVNLTPLLNSGTGTVAANGSDPVFAIVQGYGSRFAPVAQGDAGYATPGVGENITVGAGEVAGLPAGTYTLLPAYYDLLPGGFRVELTSSFVAPGSATPFGNFSTLAAVRVGYGGTTVASSLPQAAIITSGAGVRQLSQYAEETYNSFEASASTIFGAPRPALPQDAATLQIELNSLSGSAGVAGVPIDIADGSLLKTPALFSVGGIETVGNGANLEISSPLPMQIAGAGDAPVPLLSGDATPLASIVIADNVLDALSRPVTVQVGNNADLVGTRLVLGGTLSSSQGTMRIDGETPDLLLLGHADLTSSDILLTASSTGTIDVLPGATASTAAQGTAFGNVSTSLFTTDAGTSASPALTLSNSDLRFVPGRSTANAAIVVGEGATLQTDTGGSLNFVAPTGTNVEVAAADLRASYVNVQVANIDIGSDTTLADFAAILPGGLTLTDAALNTLAQNATVLSLTAQQAVNILGDVSLDTGKTDLVLNTPAIYGYGITQNGVVSQGGTVAILAPNFTWGGVAVADPLQNGNSATVSATPGGALAATLPDGQALTQGGAASLRLDATGTLTLGYASGVAVNNQVMLDRLALGFASVTLSGAVITANNQSNLSVYQTQAVAGQPGSLGDLTLNTNLLTAASGAVLNLTAGGLLTATGEAPAATGSLATLGARIDLTAGTVVTSTSIALPSGKLAITADDGIDLAAGTTIDLAGRDTKIFDQTAHSNGGTLSLEDSAASATNISEDVGARIDVGSPGGAGGAVSATDLGGTISFLGDLAGQGATSGGSFTLVAAALAGNDGSPSAFDALNAGLDAGGFTGLRAFELATGDIVVDQTLTARRVELSADTGNIDVIGTINAAGSGPGSIALAAGGTLTLEGTSLLDAHAENTARNSYGNEIDAENRAHVTLTSTGGTVLLDAGASIDVSYPDASANPQGQVVINAPRVSGAGLLDVAVSAPGALNISGAQAVNLFAFATYSPTDALGSVVQDNGSGTLSTSYSVTNSAGTLGLVQIGLDNFAFMNQVEADGAALAAGQLAGLASLGASFHLAPGVQIASSSASSGNLTISGDLDFSGLRYSDPAQFGRAIDPATAGSGEAGSILFRATGDLAVNGSVTDGFLPPPDVALDPAAKADTSGWTLFDNPGVFQPWIDPTNSDVLLPGSAFGSYKIKGTTYTSNKIVLLGSEDGSTAATTFDVSRPISLNYDITVLPVDLKSGVVIPFQATVGSASAPVPAGGWVATADVTRGGVVLYQKGQLIPAGFTFQPNDGLGAGSVLPVVVTTATDQLIPAGTNFDVFATTGPQITLAQNAALPVNALLPSGMSAFFGVQVDNGGDITTVPVKTVQLRPTSDAGVQGYLYPLAQMLPAGDTSWNLDFVAGANETAANPDAVQPRTTLQGGAIVAPEAMIETAPGSLLIDDHHYFGSGKKNDSFAADAVTAFSVIRTGTGDLQLAAGGNIDQSSLYGIYTAGTQDPLGQGLDAQFNSARQALGKNGALLPGGGGAKDTVTNALIADYQAYYPTGGGDVSVTVQGNFTSDIYGGDSNVSGIGAAASDVVGNWLWRQGSAELGQPTAWWINFGTLVDPLSSSGSVNPNATVHLAMTGFTGIGALGGGNVNVTVGGNAGQTTDRDEGGLPVTGVTAYSGEGLVIAVGGTGRLVPGSLLPVTTGGGDITLTVGGDINPLDAASYGLGARPGVNGLNTESQAVNGDLIDISGNIAVNAGAIGRIDYVYNSGTNNLFDPRAADPAVPNNGVPNGGMVVVPGDGTVSITTDRDLVLAGAGDPGRISVQGLTTTGTLTADLGVLAGFTLWQPTTSISLFSTGGNVTPTTIPNESNISIQSSPANSQPTDFRSEYPPTLLVTAATGNIIYGQDGLNPATAPVPQGIYPYLDYALETMPSPTGQVQFLAGGSILANGYVVDISGADPAGLSSILNPAFQTLPLTGKGIVETTNVLTGPQTGLSALSLFALAADTPTTNLHQDDADPARFYAAGGDIVNFQTGETLNFVQNGSALATWYLAAKPVWIEASGDIVSTGTRPTAYPGDDPLLFTQQENLVNAPSNSSVTVYSSGDLFLNNNANAISVISAGRDILSAYAYVAGPGLLEVDAGRNLYQAAYTILNNGNTQQVLSFGAIKSLGDNYLPGSPPSLTGGADIAVLAGTGAAGGDYTAFANLYFNPDNQANLALPLADPANNGKVQQVYAGQLVSWLAARYGYTGDAGSALAFFLANVPALDQAVFVRSVFFTELTESGTQESDPTSRFYKDYARGRLAIDTLFPSSGTEPTPGAPVGYTGGITAYSGALYAGGTSPISNNGGAVTFDGGIATLFGGSVQILDPGGAIEFGIPGGPAPGNNSGIITYGTGDIDIYALDSVLLGKSRIFTTGGGNITIWSSSGDINAGIGAKTTISYNPPVLSYDDVGDVSQSPPNSTSGAGIATLQPLPSVPAGDVSLIAPVGTVDAGEAGVRVSGNLVLAASRVSGTANISVKGSTQGAPTVTVASLGAVSAAASAAGAATSSAQTQGQRNNAAREAASILEVDVVSLGGSTDDERKRKKKGAK